MAQKPLKIQRKRLDKATCQTFAKLYETITRSTNEMLEDLTPDIANDEIKAVDKLIEDAESLLNQFIAALYEIDPKDLSILNPIVNGKLISPDKFNQARGVINRLLMDNSQNTALARELDPNFPELNEEAMRKVIASIDRAKLEELTKMKLPVFCWVPANRFEEKVDNMRKKVQVDYFDNYYDYEVGPHAPKCVQLVAIDLTSVNYVDLSDQENFDEIKKVLKGDAQLLEMHQAVAILYKAFLDKKLKKWLDALHRPMILRSPLSIDRGLTIHFCRLGRSYCGFGSDDLKVYSNENTPEFAVLPVLELASYTPDGLSKLNN